MKFMILATAIVATGVPSLALAEPADQPSASTGKPVVVVAKPSDLPTRRVSYRDLNLANAEGERALERRVKSAVGAVCSEALGPSPVYSGEHACRNYAWKGARPQMAMAVQRAREIAATGSSEIAAVAITVSLGD